MSLSPVSPSYSSCMSAPEVPLRTTTNLLDRLQECQEQILHLKEKLTERKKHCERECVRTLKNTFAKLTSSNRSSDTPSIIDNTPLSLSPQTRLDGISGRVTAVSWQHNGGFQLSSERSSEQRLLAAYQTGKLIVWRAQSNKVACLIKCSAWNQTCDYIEQGLIASGGLDNLITVHRLPEEGGLLESSRDFHSDHKRELIHHEAYISGVRFVNRSDGHRLVSVSGDSNIVLWDVQMSNPLCVLKEHRADCLAIDMHPSHPHLMITGAADKSSKLWDLRQQCNSHYGSGSVFTFKGHDSDVNSLRWFPDGQSFVSGSEDATMRLVDLRSLSCIADYGKKEGLIDSVDSVEVSHSGRYLFGACDTQVLVWDTLTAGIVDCLQHGNPNRKNSDATGSRQRDPPVRVNAIQISPDGQALATGAWDSQVRLWA